MKTITVDGKEYECRRYTLEELEKLFDEKTLVLEDVTFEDMNIVDGILLEACDIKSKREVMNKYMSMDGVYTFWDVSPEPILIGYRKLM